MHLHVHITNENSKTVIYTDYRSPVTVKSLWPRGKERKEMEYTENFGGESLGQKPFRRLRITLILISEKHGVRMVGNGIWLRIMSNDSLYLPPASCLVASRALFTTCLLLDLLLFNPEGGNFFPQNVWLFQITWHQKPEECTCHLQMH
jgi:hypothetical protein